MKTKDIVVVALVCANMVLAALAAGLYLGQAETAAIAQSNSRGGDYLMASGPVSGARDGLFVIDTVSAQANLYVPKAGAGAAGARWELVDVRNLATDFDRGDR